MGSQRQEVLKSPQDCGRGATAATGIEIRRGCPTKRRSWAAHATNPRIDFRRAHDPLVATLVSERGQPAAEPRAVPRLPRAALKPRRASRDRLRSPGESPEHRPAEVWTPASLAKASHRTADPPRAGYLAEPAVRYKLRCRKGLRADGRGPSFADGFSATVIGATCEPPTRRRRPVKSSRIWAGSPSARHPDEGAQRLMSCLLNGFSTLRSRLQWAAPTPTTITPLRTKAGTCKGGYYIRRHAGQPDAAGPRRRLDPAKRNAILRRLREAPSEMVAGLALAPPTLTSRTELAGFVSDADGHLFKPGQGYHQQYRIPRSGLVQVESNLKSNPSL